VPIRKPAPGAPTAVVRFSSLLSEVPTVQIPLFTRVYRLYPALLVLCLLGGCAGVPKPLTGIVPGREMETLQSSLSISMKTAGQGTGGRGYLIFKYPDRFHLAVLSPFGQTLLEVFSDGEYLTCLVPSKQAAYLGRLSELPDNRGIGTFGILKWVVERQPPPDPDAFGRVLVNARGDRLYFDKFGLVTRKVSPAGDQVRYSGYANVNGVAFAETLEIANRFGDTVRIVFDEPEINAALEPVALTPNLEGMQQFPLADFKGF
jgi:hypothetical protein